MAGSNPLPSKAEEAAEQSRANLSDVVPAYGDHTADDLYTDFNPSYQTGLPTVEDEEFVEISTKDSALEPDLLRPQPPPVILHAGLNPSYQTGLPTFEDEEFQENLIEDDVSEPDMSRPLPPPEFTPIPNERVPSPLPPPAQSGPLSLTLDKALIFPNTVPATALYSLNYTLNSMGSSITLRRSVPGPIRANGTRGKIVDKDLYDITRPPLNLLLFHIHGKRKSTYPGVGQLQLKLGLRGRYWECRFKEKLVLKWKNGCWTDGEGKVVAREENEVVSKKWSKKGKEKVVFDDGVKENPGLVFEERAGETDALLVDLMVAVWCAKTWCAETWEAKSAPPSASEGSYSWGNYLK